MNLVLSLMVLGVSGVSVWAGITDPADGMWRGLANVMHHRPNPSRHDVGAAAGAAAFGAALGLIAPTAAGPAPAAAPSNPAVAPSGARAAIVADARTWIGVPYKWGGTTRNGADCSGFLQTLFDAHGVKLGRVAAVQALSGSARSASTAQAGDLVGFGFPASHIGLYIGGGNVIHEPHPGASCRVESVKSIAPTVGPASYRDVIGAPPTAHHTTPAVAHTAPAAAPPVVSV